MNAREKKLSLVTATFAFAIVVLFGSCYWNPETGAGKIMLSLKASGRTQVDPVEVQYARVYLYADNMNTRVNIGDGAPYAEAALSSSGGSVTIDHVPAGTGYQLVLTLGTKPNGATYVPGSFAGSNTFTVTAGHETEVPLAVVTTVSTVLNTYGMEMNYDDGLLGHNVVGVACEPTSFTIAAAERSALYRGVSLPLSSTGGSLPPGATANSVSIGSGEFLVNTSSGIVPFDLISGTYGSGTSFPQSGSPTGKITESGYNSATATYLYQREGGFGGKVRTTAWFDVDLSGGSGLPTLDFAVNGAYGQTFFATKIGTFAVSNEVFGAGNNNSDYIASYAGFFTIKRNDRRLFISSVALDGGGYLYAGTRSGVYQASAGAVQTAIGIKGQLVPGSTIDLVVDAAGQVIPGTAGHPFRKVVGSYLSSVVAAISDTTLVVSGVGNGSTFVLPLAAVALGDVNGIAIDPYGNYLYVAGTEGLTEIPLVGG